MEFIDGQLLNCLWFSLTEPENASIAYEVADIIVNSSEVNLDGIGCLTVKHSLGPTVEGFEVFKGRVSLSLSRMCQHTVKRGLRMLIAHSGTNFTLHFSNIGSHPATHAYVTTCYDDDELRYYTPRPKT